MCENNETTIRYQGLLGTLIACPTAVPSKYTFVENILFTLAKDTDQTISTMCIKILGPILARSSIINGT